MGSSTRTKTIPDKLFYKIGEVSEIADVESYVLRYWESEFPFLKPRKNKSVQRVYARKDLELVIQIKNLLYKEKYTIAGVRKRFSDNSIKKSSVSIETIRSIKKRLKGILTILK